MLKFGIKSWYLESRLLLSGGNHQLPSIMSGSFWSMGQHGFFDAFFFQVELLHDVQHGCQLSIAVDFPGPSPAQGSFAACSAAGYGSLGSMVAGFCAGPDLQPDLPLFCWNGRLLRSKRWKDQLSTTEAGHGERRHWSFCSDHCHLPTGARESRQGL